MIPDRGSRSVAIGGVFWGSGELWGCDKPGFSVGALDVGGAFPSGELVGVAAVFVLDEGVEAGDDGLGAAEEGVDGGGVFDAFEVVVVFSVVDAVDGLEIGAEIGDEVGGDLEGDELGAEGAVFLGFQKFKECLGVGDGGGFCVVGRIAVGGGWEAGLV